jgi:hypothetical protein
MIENVATLSVVKITTPAVTIAGTQGRDVSPGIERMLLAGDGQVDPTFVGVGRQAPTIAFDTVHVAAFLDDCGISGVGVTSLDAYFQMLEAGGLRKIGNTHHRIRIGSGYLVPRGIRADAGSPAVLSAMVYGDCDDGATCPLSLLTAQALPAGAGVTEMFTCGPVSLDGQAYATAGIAVDFGLNVQNAFSDGSVFPTYPYAENRQPSITIRTADAAALATIGESGVAIDDPVTVVLRKIAAYGTRVAENQAEHICFTVNAGMIYVARAAGGNPDMTDVLVVPTWDETNPILDIDTEFTITPDPVP